MYHVPIHASPAQLSKLRRGQPVRVKQGTGFNLLVHPSTYNIVARAFSKGKGAEIALSPPELQANAQASSGTPVAIQNPNHPQAGGETAPTISGSGIFGDVGDKYLKKAGIKDMAYRMGDYAKPLVKAGIGTALTAGGVALGAVQPELIPGIPFAVAGGTALASDFLDHPQRYLGKSGVKGNQLNNMAQQHAHAQMTEQLNNQLGTNYDYLRQAGLANAVAHKSQADMNASSIASRMSSGEGLRRHSHMREHAITGRGGGMIGSSSSFVPPALESQPFSANFQFQHFFPPQYQSMMHHM
jgi:hypothetical protein